VEPAALRVKVCGITRGEDALRAADLGADAVGFVFAEKSRRRADPETVRRIVQELPPLVTAVGVFQDQQVGEVRGIVEACRLDLAQLHGSEDAAYIQALGLKVVKAVHIARRRDLETLAAYPGLKTFLLDAAVGGSGASFDWAWAVAAKRFGRIVLAGGLHPGNVAEAIRRVRPWAVDAASGTEISPGIKDPEKLRLFIRNARAAAESLAAGSLG
jgi:phosphoribosylanthranilate isomerase